MVLLLLEMHNCSFLQNMELTSFCETGGSPREKQNITLEPHFISTADTVHLLKSVGQTHLPMQSSVQKRKDFIFSHLIKVPFLCQRCLPKVQFNQIFSLDSLTGITLVGYKIELIVIRNVPCDDSYTQPLKNWLRDVIHEACSNRRNVRVGLLLFLPT